MYCEKIEMCNILYYLIKTKDYHIFAALLKHIFTILKQNNSHGIEQ